MAKRERRSVGYNAMVPLDVYILRLIKVFIAGMVAMVFVVGMILTFIIGAFTLVTHMSPFIQASLLVGFVIIVIVGGNILQALVAKGRGR